MEQSDMNQTLFGHETIVLLKLHYICRLSTLTIAFTSQGDVVDIKNSGHRLFQKAAAADK